MALIHAHFYSDTLGMQRTIEVILPQHTKRNSAQAGEGDKRIPVLYLLHGWSDDHTGWQRRTSIERYAAEKGLAVIMPGSDLGFYTDMKYGYDFWQFFSKELPTLVHEFFPRLSTQREDTFVAGLSMGGFGALKLGVNCPERFSAVASLSGLTDPLWAYRSGNKDNESAWFNVFGNEDDLRGSVNDIHYIMEELIASGKRQPRFFQTCGTEDFLYEVNVAFRDRFKGRIDLTYHEEVGTHEWDYWDRNIRRVIEWLPLAAKEAC